MYPIQLTSGKIKIGIEFPSCWNELTKNELLKYCMPIAESISSSEWLADFTLFLLKERLQVKGYEVDDRVLQLLDLETLFHVSEKIKWIFETNTLTDQKIPFIEIKDTKFYGPISEFENLTVGEYEEANGFAEAFRNTKDKEWLQKLGATLYRKLDDNEQRESLDVLKINSKLFASIPSNYLAAIFVWWKGCQRQLVEDPIFHLVFPKNGSGESDPLAFTKTIHSGAGPENGTRSDVRKLPLREFLFDLQLKLEQSGRMKRELETRK